MSNFIAAQFRTYSNLICFTEGSLLNQKKRNMFSPKLTLGPFEPSSPWVKAILGAGAGQRPGPHCGLIMHSMMLKQLSAVEVLAAFLAQR